MFGCLHGVDYSLRLHSLFAQVSRDPVQLIQVYGLHVHRRYCYSRCLHWYLFWWLYSQEVAVKTQRRSAAGHLFQHSMPVLLCHAFLFRLWKYKNGRNHHAILHKVIIFITSRFHKFSTNFTGQVFSKGIEITPEIHIRKFDQIAWGRVPCWGSFLTSTWFSGLVWTMWMSEMNPNKATLLKPYVLLIFLC